MASSGSAARVARDRYPEALIGVAAVAGSLAHACLSPLFSSGDEMAHFDYAYQVWHGHLPIFERGLAVDPPWGFRPPVQWTAQHPPLFYAILSPAVGPLMDAGRPYAAGMAARAVNALLAGLLCWVVVWAVRGIVGRHREIALVAGFAVASAAWIFGVGGAVYNDVLGALVVATAVGAVARLLRDGPRGKWWWVLAFASMAAGLTRLALVPVIGLALLAVVAKGLFQPREARRREWLWPVVAIGAAMVASSGWFYARNVRLTGSISGAHPGWALEHTSRSHVPVAAIVSSPRSWAKLFGIFSYANDPGGVSLWLLLVVPVIVAAVAVTIRSLRSGVRRWWEAHGAMALFLVALGGLVAAMQFFYASSAAGNIFPRYSFPAIVPLALAVGVGIGGFGRGSVAIFGAWAVVAWVEFLRWVQAQPTRASAGEAALLPGASRVFAGIALLAATGAAIGIVGRLWRARSSNV